MPPRHPKYRVVYNGDETTVVLDGRHTSYESVSDPMGFEVAKLKAINYLRIIRDNCNDSIRHLRNSTTKDIDR